MSSHSIPPARTVIPADSLARRLHDLVHHGIAFGADRLAAPDQAWWRTVAGTGTRPWLDTGDMDEAASLWCSSFSVFTSDVIRVISRPTGFLSKNAVCSRITCSKS